MTIPVEINDSFASAAGFGTETVDGDSVVVQSLAGQLMTWEEPDNSQDEGESVTSESP